MKNLAEYYDELYPISQEQQAFYEELLKTYPYPAKLLRIGCGTGYFEHKLARQGYDVTGLEVCSEMLESATRRRRLPVTAIRFFNMSTIEMGRFLGKKFYNIISCLNDRLIFIHDAVLMRKFFYDCKSLLSQNGTLILQLPNFEYFSGEIENLPTLSSIRAKLFTRIERAAAKSDKTILSQTLETGNRRRISIIQKAPIYPITCSEIEKNAREAGFADMQVYSGFDRKPAAADSANLLCVIR